MNTFIRRRLPGISRTLDDLPLLPTSASAEEPEEWPETNSTMDLFRARRIANVSKKLALVGARNAGERTCGTLDTMAPDEGSQWCSESSNNSQRLSQDPDELLLQEDAPPARSTSPWPASRRERERRASQSLDDLPFLPLSDADAPATDARQGMSSTDAPFTGSPLNQFARKRHPELVANEEEPEERHAMNLTMEHYRVRRMGNLSKKLTIAGVESARVSSLGSLPSMLDTPDEVAVRASASGAAVRSLDAADLNAATPNAQSGGSAGHSQSTLTAKVPPNRRLRPCVSPLATRSLDDLPSMTEPTEEKWNITSCLAERRSLHNRRLRPCVSPLATRSLGDLPSMTAPTEECKEPLQTAQQQHSPRVAWIVSD
jgi:hypothetical protein